jgi:hypothetical protein
MSLTDDIKDIKEKLERDEKEKQLLLEAEQGKKKTKKFRWPKSASKGAKKNIKAGKTLALILRKNRTADFKWIENFGGLAQYGQYGFSEYEMSAVYNTGKYPLIVIPEWRLNPAGGKIEQAEQDGFIKIDIKLFGGISDILISNTLDVGDQAQQTMIRVMEKVESDMSAKKKGNFGWLLWVGIGLVAIYIIGKLIGWW